MLILLVPKWLVNRQKHSLATTWITDSLLSFSKQKLLSILWFQFLHCEDKLFVLYDCEWNITQFWMVAWTEQDIWRCHFGLKEIAVGTVTISCHFIDQAIIKKEIESHFIDNKNMCQVQRCIFLFPTITLS